MISAGELETLDPGIDAAESKAKRLSRLGLKMLEQGSIRGVTALKTEEGIKNEFLLDSLRGLASLPARGSVIDIGTGGGVPGLVLAIARPDLAFTLTDSAQKKTNWVKECVEELEIANVEVKTARLEILGREAGVRESFAAVTAKALSSLSVLLELAFPLLEVGGKLIAYKGPALDQEIADASHALKLLSARVGLCRTVEHQGKTYKIAEFVKLKATGARYPRRDGLPQKTPL